jgi:Ca2+-transporting ATPase
MGHGLRTVPGLSGSNGTVLYFELIGRCGKMGDWYKKTVNEVLQELAVSLSEGLSMNQAEDLIKKYGYNELKEKEKETLLQKIIAQLKDFLIIILIVASIVSAAMGEITDSIVIIAIVVVNAVLGVMQEGKAEKALEALKKMSAPNARAFRNGKIEVIPAKVLVPGDIILIEAGDILPADIRLVESVNLKIYEASLFYCIKRITYSTGNLL